MRIVLGAAAVAIRLDALASCELTNFWARRLRDITELYAGQGTTFVADSTTCDTLVADGVRNVAEGRRRDVASRKTLYH